MFLFRKNKHQNANGQELSVGRSGSPVESDSCSCSESFLASDKHESSHRVAHEMIANSFTHNLNDSILTSQSNLLLQDFKDSLQDSSITMLPNYDIKPSGQEHGNFLCIDLGGSTLRIAVVEIRKPDELDDEQFDLQEEDRAVHEQEQEQVNHANLLKIPTNNSSESKLNLTNLNDRTDSSIDSQEYDKSFAVPSRVNVIVERKWTMENSNKTINIDFFKFIAEKISEILSCQSLIDSTSVVSTGITWSFPLKTTNHNSGRIVHVSKGYTIAEEVFNKDLKTILEGVCRDYFDIAIDVKCVFNDSLAVYSAGLFFDSHTKLALVLGTGFNVCCPMDSENLPSEKLLPDNGRDASKVLVNTEMSLFGDQMLPYFTNKFDYSIEPRFKDFQFDFRCFMSGDEDGKLMQPTEMMTSGRYLPELTRLVLVDLINDEHIFRNIADKSLLSRILTVPYDGFDGELMCFISESDNVSHIIETFSKNYSIDKNLIHASDIATLKEVVYAITQRAAFIVAISIISFLKLLKQSNRLDEKLVVISYVGSVLTYFHNYRNEIKRFINSNAFVKEAGITVDFKLVDNSSIIGAAIGAAYFSEV